MKRESILVTGGAGFIGTHVLAALSQAGYVAVAVDNFCNSVPEAVARVRKFAPNVTEPVRLDLRDGAALRELLASRTFDAVVHLAALKSIDESIREPARYHDNNVTGMRTLLDALAGTPIRRLVFSSSATIYGPVSPPPFAEDTPLAPHSPYGETKVACETLLHEAAARDPRWRIAILRYFNPAGAHPGGTLGEAPRGTPGNLFPVVCRAAAGEGRLRVFGNDYPTVDGTGLRDYVHVMDLAEGHVAALRHLDREPAGAPLVANLGAGRGYTALQVIRAFERVNGLSLAVEMAPRRPGDVAASYADCTRAKEVLGWHPTRSLEDICRDAWRWTRANPRGYE